MTCYKSEEWKTRIEASREAQQRTRFTLIVVTIASVSIFIAEFNALFSWNRFFAMAPLTSEEVKQFPFPASPGKTYTKEEIADAVQLTKNARAKVAEDWIKSTSVNVSLLGATIGISDLAILGSGSLYILSIWFFFAARRENHVIGLLLIDAAECPDQDLRSYVFYGISSQTVFKTVSDDDHPIRTLQRITKPVAGSRRWSIGAAFGLMVALPAIAIFFILFCDVFSLDQAAVFRYPHVTLTTLMSDSQHLRVVVMDAVALVFGLLTAYNCAGVMGFSSSTQFLLKEFYNLHFANAVSQPLSSPPPRSPGASPEPIAGLKGTSDNQVAARHEWAAVAPTISTAACECEEDVIL